MNFRRAALLLLLLLITIGVLLPVSPIFRPAPTVDTSVYLYVGQRILEGGVPYRDAWDHKQPVVYLLYAFAQLVTPGSLWGPWILLLVMVGLSGAFLFEVVRRSGGDTLAFFSVSAGLFALSTILWGGSIEELSILWQSISIFAYVMVRTSQNLRKKLGYSALLGASFGLAFFSKQNLIAAGAAAVVCLAVEFLAGRRWKEWFIFPAVGAGFFLVALPLFVYLAQTGALNDYWTAAFVFNTRYSGTGLIEQIQSAFDAVEIMAETPGLQLSLAAWFVCSGLALMLAGPLAARWVENTKIRQAGVLAGLALVGVSLILELAGGKPGFGLVQIFLLATGSGLAVLLGFLSIQKVRAQVTPWLRGTSWVVGHPTLLYFLVIYFLFILFFLTISGRNYLYYFIAFIPFLVTAFGEVSETTLSASTGIGKKIVWAGVLGAWLSIAIVPVFHIILGLSSPVDPRGPQIGAYIQANSLPAETIYAWGKPSTYAYLVGKRKAPSRYFYQAAVTEEGFNADYQVSDEILNDFITSPPRLFLFYQEGPAQENSGECPLFTSSEANSPGRIFQYVCDHYDFQGKVGEFLVFRRP